MALKYFNVINGITAGNITLDATTGNTTVTNLAVTSLTSLGNVTNVSITGGATGQVLTTDGLGNLTWSAVAFGDSISNGNSNVSIPVANGNVEISVAGNTNVVTITGTAIYRDDKNIPTHVYQANTAPANPLVGDQWYNTFNGILFEYLDDGTNSQWVDISTVPYPNVAPDASTVQTNVATTGTVFLPFISDTANGAYPLISNATYSANLANGSLSATTFVGELSGTANVTSLTVTDLASLGDISNISIAGGNAGQVLTTDGTGNLNFTTPSASSTGNIFVNTRANTVVKILVQLGSIVIMGRTGNINIPVQS